ncbi:MAG: NADH-quinone oxidoreductase subunit J [Sphaerobacter sp.]|nr:NADH-quinone oxidoreductase subunit J [Sphaerobacter sp.]
MSAEVLVFDILGAIAVLAAAGVVLARNPVHSALALVVSFVNVAAIYVILRAEFLAAAQIIVYTGAILVLVLFVIMLVDPDNLPEFHGGRPVQRLLALILGLALLGEVMAAILTRTIVGQPGPWSPQAVAAVGGNTQALGRVLYSGYVLPIQVTAVLLLAATIGALVLARPDTPRVRALVRDTATISLAHPRGSEMANGVEPALPALAAGQLKLEAGERTLVMAKSGDDFLDQPVWGERHQS